MNQTEVLELKTVIIETKTHLDEFQRRIEKTLEIISEFEDIIIEITQPELYRENRKNQQSFRDQWNNNKKSIFFVLGVPEVKDYRAKKVFEEILAENVPNLSKGINLSIQKSN